MWPSQLLFRRAKVENILPLYSTFLHFSSLLLKTLGRERLLRGGGGFFLGIVTRCFTMLDALRASTHEEALNVQCFIRYAEPFATGDTVVYIAMIYHQDRRRRSGIVEGRRPSGIVDAGTPTATHPPFCFGTAGLHNSLSATRIRLSQIIT